MSFRKGFTINYQEKIVSSERQRTLSSDIETPLYKCNADMLSRWLKEESRGVNLLLTVTF